MIFEANFSKLQGFFLFQPIVCRMLTVEIKDDGFGQSLRAVVIVARTCKFSVAMLPVKTFNFHRISRLSRDNFFEAAIDQLTILPPTDTTGWTSFRKKRQKIIYKKFGQGFFPNFFQVLPVLETKNLVYTEIVIRKKYIFVSFRIFRF